MKYLITLKAVWAPALLFSDVESAMHVAKYDFMKIILSRGHRKIARVIQPVITESADKLLQSYHDSIDDFEYTSIADRAKEYVGPLRRIPKKNWKARPGGLKLQDPTPKADFSKPWFYEWDKNGQYIGEEGARQNVSPIETLIQLSQCLNYAGSLTVSPSDRYIDLNRLAEPNSWITPETGSTPRRERRFDLEGEYRLMGTEVGVPDDPETWNIFSKHTYHGGYKKLALGMCVNLTNNQGFSVVTQRYTDAGRVKKASAIAQELEEKCKKHAYTFLASTFIPG
jgi:hypothetical protein